MSLIREIKIPNARVLREDFYILMESHVPYLRKHSGVQVVEVSAQTADVYMGDFHGLLANIGVEKKYHYLITRVNGYNTSTDYDGLKTSIVLPPVDEMNKIFEIYSSRSD